MEYLSASKLKKFRKCPYSLQEPFTANPATNFGSAVHAGIAEAYKGNPQFMLAYQNEARKLEIPVEKDAEAKAAIDFALSLEIPRDSILTIESEDGNAHYFNKNFVEVPFTDKWGIRGAMDLVYVDDNACLNIVDWVYPNWNRPGLHIDMRRTEARWGCWNNKTPNVYVPLDSAFWKRFVEEKMK